MSHEHKDVDDVTMIGAGPTGLSATYELKRIGLYPLPLVRGRYTFDLHQLTRMLLSLTAGLARNSTLREYLDK